jgi:hypothetical protein
MNLDQTTEEQLQTYLAQGYRHRTHYLESLCEEYDSETVYTLAVLLGPSEDFDGLITALEDSEEEWDREESATREKQLANDAAYAAMLEECRHA